MAGYGPLSNVSNGIIGAAMRRPARPRIFVSYHHKGDQWYYDEFSRYFHDQWETVFDNSLDDEIDSDNTDYVMRRIREDYIHGTSCTIVLIGAQTHQRKYVDWEIKATLDKQHGLIGVVLPTAQLSMEGKVIVPDRFFDNLGTGFASMMKWSDLNGQSLQTAMNYAAFKQKNLINNARALKARNG